jgi:hypothetical protein
MYIELAKKLIEDYKVTIVQDSKCWQRVHAHTDGTRRICKWKLADSYASLYLLLHEIGHLETDKPRMKRCEQESEAVKWSHQKLKELGLPVKRRYAFSYKRYVRRTWERGIRRGLSKHIKSSLYI